MAIQEDLRVERPEAVPAELGDEEEPRRRPWAAVASVVLALALIFVAYQWNQAATRAEALATQLRAVRADAESYRLRAEEAGQKLAEVQKRLAALAADRAALEERVAALERAARERAGAAAGVRSRVPLAGTRKGR